MANNRTMTAYLVFDERRVLRSTTKMPGLAQGEYAVRVQITFPMTLFARVIPTAELTIPETAVFAPVVEVVQPIPPGDANVL